MFSLTTLGKSCVYGLHQWSTVTTSERIIRSQLHRQYSAWSRIVTNEIPSKKINGIWELRRQEDLCRSNKKSFWRSRVSWTSVWLFFLLGHFILLTHLTGKKREEIMDLNGKKWRLDILKNLHWLNNNLILSIFLYPLFVINNHYASYGPLDFAVHLKITLRAPHSLGMALVDSTAALYN